MNTPVRHLVSGFAVACAAMLMAPAHGALINFSGQPNGWDTESAGTAYTNLSGGITSTGPNLGAAIFDSTTGVNAADPDLWVNLGNILILQSEDSPGKTGNVWNTPNDEADGGTLIFDWDAPVEMLSLDLVDINGNGPVFVTLFDANGLTRTYNVPLHWTNDISVEGPNGYDTLDLTTVNPQDGEGPGGPATAAQQAGFNPMTVVLFTVQFTGSAGLDNIKFNVIPAPSVVSVLLGGLLLSSRRRRR